MSRFRPQSTRSVLWEVLAPYLRWPLYSPLRLLVVVGAVLLAFATVARLHGPSSRSASAPTPTLSGGTWSTPSGGATDTSASAVGTTDPSSDISLIPRPTSGASSVPARPSVPVRPFVPRPVADRPTTVAEAFVTAWARRDAQPADWRRGVSAYSTSTYAALLSRTDPRRIPATRRTGNATVVRATATDAVVQVPTDGLRVAVTLVRQQNRWRVSAIAPVSGAQAAPTPDLSPLPSSTATSSTAAPTTNG